MGQVTQNTCEHVIKYAHRGERFPLTANELGQMAHLALRGMDEFMEGGVENAGEALYAILHDSMPEWYPDAWEDILPKYKDAYTKAANKQAVASYTKLLTDANVAKDAMQKRGVDYHRLEIMFPQFLAMFDDLTSQLNYMKASHAEEKRRRENLELRLAVRTEAPVAIVNADTKNDPELREKVNDNTRWNMMFNTWYNKRYGNPDLTDTWKHAAYQDAREVWMACAELLSTEYQQRARSWRDSFDAMHRRAMSAEQRAKDLEAALGNVNKKFIDATVIIETLRAASGDEVAQQKIKELETQLSGERGQVEIWKQRTTEWCDKFNAIAYTSDTDAEKYRAAFVSWWCRDIPNNLRPSWDKTVDDAIKAGKMNHGLAGAWEGFQFGIAHVRSGGISKEKASELVKEYGRALMRRHEGQMQAALDTLVGYLAYPILDSEEAKECLLDVITHHNDFFTACQQMEAIADSTNRGYWEHQRKVLNRMRAQAERALDEMGVDRPQSTWTNAVEEMENVGDESHHSHLNGGSL